MALNDLYIVQIDDPYIRENFRKIKSYGQDQYFFNNLKLFEISIAGNVTNYRFKHNLGFQPKDVIQTSVIGGSITWNYSLFNKEFLDITTSGVSGTITVRALIGNLDEE